MRRFASRKESFKLLLCLGNDAGRFMESYHVASVSESAAVDHVMKFIPKRLKSLVGPLRLMSAPELIGPDGPVEVDWKTVFNA